MVPSQTRLVLSAITGDKLWKERVDFWQSIYGVYFSSTSDCRDQCTANAAGFDMSAMNKTYFGEGLIDVMDAKEIVSDEQIIKVSLRRCNRDE